MPPIPSPEVIDRVQAGFATVYSRVDIYDPGPDGALWYEDAPVVDGSVSVDMGRDERRTATLVLANYNGSFDSQPNGFWYDKVIRIYRGIRGHSDYILDENDQPILDPDNNPILDDTVFTPDYETQIGQFFIDDIDMGHHPNQVQVSLRDGTSRLMLSKFANSTEFESGVSIESVVQAIAFAGGIPSEWMDLPLTGINTERIHTYDRTSVRWDAIKEIGQVYGYDIFFDYRGMLVMVPFADPADPGVSPSIYTFEAGGRGFRNPNFNKRGVDGMPDWWSTVHNSQPDDLTIGWSSDGQQWDGEAALLFSFDGAVAAGIGTVLSKATSVTVGEVYRISIRSKATDISSDSQQAVFVAFSNDEDDPDYISNQVDIVAPGTAYTYEYLAHEAIVTVPPGVQWMRLGIGAGTTAAIRVMQWYDEVIVERLFPVDDIKGNIVTYSKKTSSSFIYNKVVAYGDSAQTIPVSAEATNTEPTSPTNIDRLGERTFFYKSAFITTTDQAQEIADRFLKVQALESFDIGLESVVAPWLDPNSIVTFYDPEGVSTDPVRYLLSSLTIPLRPGTMQANAKRVSIVG